MTQEDLQDLLELAIQAAIKAAIVAFVVLKVAFWMGCFSGIIVVAGPHPAESSPAAAVARR